MATSLEEEEFPKKRYNAKYVCKTCQETWKSRNTTHLKMICKNPNCRKLVRSYKFEVISKLVVYQCKSCNNKVKKTKCSSEVKEVPYCTICQKDMEVLILKDLWRKRRMFGHYLCDDCNNEWQSGYAWEGVGQKCRLCNIPVVPFRLEPLKYNPLKVKGQPHRTDLCDMCKALGHNCKSYNPTSADDIALMNEVPLEEDTQSVITTNSSVFGASGSDHDDDDDGSCGGDRTPVNLSDVELDDQEPVTVEEMFSKLKLGHTNPDD